MISIAGIGIGAFSYFSARAPHSTFINPTDGGLVVQGQAIYTNNCAACHGAMLQGPPNWRERLANGRLPSPSGYQSDMPVFSSVLNDEQIVAVLAYIKSTWPSDVLRMQKEVAEQQQ